jgi:hypothetical protein
MPTQIIKVMTNEEGAYQRVDQFNPPGWFNLTVDLTATLLSPADTTITGTIDIDAEDGHPQNQSKDFTLSTDQQESLGEWHLDGGNNTLSVSGQTEPVRANTQIEIEVDINLLGF